MQIALQLKRNLANLLRFFSYVATLLVGDSRSVRSSAAKEFVRVLDPIDPWLDPSRQHDRVTQFIGSYENISVAMRSRCPDELILASFHGPKRATGPINPLRPSLFAFASLEVKEAGGKIEDTDAKPPWPPEYNYAHHDIICNQQSVAAAMSDSVNQNRPGFLKLTKPRFLWKSRASCSDPTRKSVFGRMLQIDSRDYLKMEALGEIPGLKLQKLCPR